MGPKGEVGLAEGTQVVGVLLGDPQAGFPRFSFGQEVGVEGGGRG